MNFKNTNPTHYQKYQELEFFSSNKDDQDSLFDKINHTKQF